MHYIVFLLFLIMSAGCVTTGSTIGTIPEVEAVTLPVSNSPIPPTGYWAENTTYMLTPSTLLVLVFLIRILFQQVSRQEQS